MNDDDLYDDMDYEPEDDPMDECYGWFDGGVFVCGAVGSEDCDCCPMYKWLGLTEKEIDALEDAEMEKRIADSESGDAK